MLEYNKEWFLKNIPKILFLYWGKNKPLSFLRYMTVLSFSKLNPDWKIIICYPDKICYDEPWRSFEQKNNKYCGIDYFQYLDYIPNVQFKKTRCNTNIPEVFKSDVIRSKLLSDNGGVWSDFDILFTKPITYLHLNIEANRDIDSVICKYKYAFAGFLMCKSGSILYKNLYETVSELKIMYYTSILDKGYLKVFNDVLENEIVANLDMSSVYPISWKETEELLNNIPQEEHTIGIHWYAGSNIMSSHEGEELCKCDSALCKEARRIYEI